MSITTVNVKEFTTSPALVIAQLIGDDGVRRWSPRPPEDARSIIALSRRGRVVAALRAVTPAELAEGDLALTEDSFIPSSELHRRGVSSFVRRAEGGEHLVLTYRNTPVGILGPVQDLLDQLPAMSTPPPFNDGTRYLSGGALDERLEATDTER